MSAVSETEMVSAHVIIYLFYCWPQRSTKWRLEVRIAAKKLCDTITPKIRNIKT